MKNFFIRASVVVSIFAINACSVTSSQSTVGEYVDDTTITTRVKARLVKDDKVSAMRINVETLKGVVILSGFAVSNVEKNRAAEVTRSVPHVKEVRNSIIVESNKSDK